MSDVAFEDNARFEHAFQSYLDESGKDRAEAHGAFRAGWLRRVAAARASLSSTNRHPEDAVMFEVMRLLEEHNKHLDRLAFSEWRVSRQYRREADQLRAMIRDRGQDPNEAPLWRRITEQRKQIKDLSRIVTMLRGQLAEITNGGGTQDD